jgi:hypothetical protein
MEEVEQTAESNDVPENKDSYRLFGKCVRKIEPFEYNRLGGLSGAGSPKKGGPRK